MAIDEVPEQKSVASASAQASNSSLKFGVIFVILAALVIAEVYAFTQFSATRGSLDQSQAAQRTMSAQLEQLSSKIAAVESSNAQQLQAVKEELDSAATRLGRRTGGELRRARAMVAKLQTEQQKQSEELKQEIAQKADQQQVGALTQDVNAQRTDLESTKKNVSSLSSDLGMARSEFGTLIARNHQDIEYLRKLGERDYYEFTLTQNQPGKVANVELNLRKTNVKRHQFTVNLVVDDMTVEKKNRTINEPLIFYVGGSKKPYEMVVNGVQSRTVKGYISTPKGAIEVATRSGGAQ